MADSEGMLEQSQESKLILSVLNALVTPPEAGVKISDVQSSFQNNYIKAIATCSQEKADEWIAALGFVYTSEDFTWKFVSLTVACLLRLQNIPEILYSVNEKACIRSSIQFVSGLSLQPFLHAGSKAYKQSGKDLSDQENQQRLSEVITALLKLLDNKSWALYGVVLPTLLPDLLPTLIQLAWDPVNSKFQAIITKLLDSLHQPTVIRELLVCIKTDHQKPIWFVKACSKYLTYCLMAPRGVIATVRALHDIASQNDDRSYHTTAKLLAGPHGVQYHQKMCPQLLELLLSSNTDYVHVSVYTIQLLWPKKSSLCADLILKPLCSNLIIDFGDLEGNLVLEAQQEEMLSSSINALLSLSKALPSSAVLTCVPQLCQLYLAIRRKGGTPQLRTVTKDLITKIMSSTDDKDTWKTFYDLPEDCLLDLADESAAANSLFLNLLNALDKTEDIEEKILYCKLLVSVAEIPSVQKDSLQKPNQLLINTIKSFLEDSDCDMVPIALLLLGIMVSECEEWSQYQCLVPALQKLRKSITLPEGLRAVAEEIISTVATLGAALGSQSSTNASVRSPGKNLTFDQVIQDINNEDIPTQGHGFIALKKLIAMKDAKTLSSELQVFELCMKGMQHEDSYVYLAAIGALSALALSSLDTHLPSLVSHYSNVGNEPTLRTRLGESLLQVCKGLGELAGKYKNMLLNAFLNGAKDQSPAIRSSSLSNLGEACRILGFKVKGDIQEILCCAQSLASSDPEIEVRRAATLLMSLLLRGLGKDAVVSLGSNALELYQSMKKLALSEDPTLSLQAQLALDELKQGITQDLFAPQPIQKKIYISSPPP